MPDSLDDFIKEIQHHIDEELREAYGEVAFERWLKPQYLGVMDDPDGYGHFVGSCGDRMEIFLKFEKDKVKEATFRTDGCGSSLVCGSYAAEVALGKTPNYEQVLAGVKDRDAIDSSRDMSPLKPAEDAIILNSDNLDIKQVLDAVEALWK